MKTISLLGSGAFETWAEEVDRLALGSSSGDARAVVLLVGRAGAETEARAAAASRHFEHIGAPATVLRIGARHDSFVTEHRDAVDGVCILHLFASDSAETVRVLIGTPLWDAVLSAMDRGAAFTASEEAIGALGDATFEEEADGPHWDECPPALRLLDGTMLVPHWDALGRERPGLQERLAREVPTDETLIGIDDRTALIGDGDLWQVKGAGQVQIRIGDLWNTYGDGAAFLLPSSVTVLPEAGTTETPRGEHVVLLSDDSGDGPNQEPDLLVG